MGLPQDYGQGPLLRIVYWGHSIGTGELVLSWEQRNWAFRDWGIITLLGIAEFGIPGLRITDLGIPSLKGRNYGLFSPLACVHSKSPTTAKQTPLPPPPSPLSNFPYLRALCPGGTAHADEKIREGGRGRGEGSLGLPQDYGQGPLLRILYWGYSIWRGGNYGLFSPLRPACILSLPQTNTPPPSPFPPLEFSLSACALPRGHRARR